MTSERKKRIAAVLAKRQPTLHVVLENVDDPHNVGAILRSCDAFGVGEVHLLYHAARVALHASSDNMKRDACSVKREEVKRVASSVSRGMGRMPRLSEIHGKSSASAAKWLKITRWDSPKKFVAFLKKKKIKLAVTHLSAKAVDVAQANLARPTVIAIGNEHDGISSELLKAADVNIRIPMVGFVQSFNVSVAAAILLYEAYRQREGEGMYGTRSE